MKICTQCNSRFPDQVNFCQVCGAKLPEPVETVVVPETESAAAPAEKKKGLLWWHILLIVVSVLVVAGIVVAVVFFAAKNNDNNPDDGEGITQEADEDEDDDDDSDGNGSVISGDEQTDADIENTTSKTENMTASDGSPLDSSETTTNNNGSGNNSSGNNGSGNNSSGNNSSSSNGNSTVRPRPSGSDAGFSSEDEAINAVLKGKYYMSSTDDEAGSIELAISGNNMELYMSVEGMQMGILLLNGETYFVNSENHYVNINELADFMDGEFDTSEMVALTDTFNFAKYNFTRTEKSAAMLDGKQATLYRYKDGATELVFYFVSGELKVLEFYPEGVADGYVMAINDFRSVIPSDMLTLNGREEADLFVFFLEMMGSMQ